MFYRNAVLTYLKNFADVYAGEKFYMEIAGLLSVNLLKNIPLGIPSCLKVSQILQRLFVRNLWMVVSLV